MKKGKTQTSMTTFRITKAMRRNAPKDDYSLTDEERQKILEYNKRVLEKRKKK